MKKIILTTVTLFITALIYAQPPEKMSYQAVVRDGSNNLVTSSSVGMQLSIIQGSANGTAVYVETQTPTSNANGLVSLEIGDGTIVSGDFSTIDWADGPYFIQTETDPTGGTNYTITGTSQLLSVPYALHAKTADNLSTPISGLDDFNYWGKYSNGLYTNENRVLIGDVDTSLNYYPRLYIFNESSSTSRGAEINVNSDTYTGTNDVVGTYTGVFGSNNNNHIGLIGRTDGSGSGRQVGARGVNESSGTGFGAGVEGLTFSSGNGTQTGLYGQANPNTTSSNYAIYGVNPNSGNSTYNAAIYGEAANNPNDNYGIDGTANSTVGNNYGTTGWAWGTTAGNNYGLYGFVNNSTTTNVAVFGKVNGLTAPINYAGYFKGADVGVEDGDVYVTNSLNGVILTSPDNQCWRVTVDNTGAISTTAVACPDVVVE